MRDAAAQLAARLRDELEQQVTAPSLRLVVAGLSSFAEYSRFEQALPSRLKSVSEVRLASAERGELQFEVKLEQDWRAFADEVARKSVADFKLKVTEQSKTRVVVHAVR